MDGRRTQGGFDSGSTPLNDCAGTGNASGSCCQRGLGIEVYEYLEKGLTRV